MFFFFRKRLLLDTSAAELMRVKHILDANGIPYEVKTTTAENCLSRRFNAHAATVLKESYDKVSVQTYVYYLYVRPKDFSRAKQLTQ